MATAALERRPATWEEYLAEDVRSEYIDGSIVTAPLPSRQHQNTVDHLMTVLKSAVPEGYGVIAGWGWKPGNDEFGPDVMVYPETEEEIRFTGIPVLCVEVVSGNRGNDYVTKIAKYAQAGLDHYWIVDPAEGGCLNVLARDGEHYVLDQIVTTDRPQDVSFGIATGTLDLADILS